MGFSNFCLFGFFKRNSNLNEKKKNLQCITNYLESNAVHSLRNSSGNYDNLHKKLKKARESYFINRDDQILNYQIMFISG